MHPAAAFSAIAHIESVEPFLVLETRVQQRGGVAHALAVGRSLVEHLAGQVERLAIASRLHEQIEPAGTHAQVRTHEHGIPRVGHDIVVER